MKATSRKSGFRKTLEPILVIFGSILLFGYGVIALLSQDPLWFLSRLDMPDPRQIVIRVDGDETTLTASSPHYDPLVSAARQALSGYESWARGSMGLSPSTLEEYQSQGTILELYFDESLDFHLPFSDGGPTQLLFPLQGRHGGQGYVFRGKRDRWWAGQLKVSDPQPLMDALISLGYVEQ